MRRLGFFGPVMFFGSCYRRLPLLCAAYSEADARVYSLDRSRNNNLR